MNQRIKIDTWDGHQFFIYFSTMCLCCFWLLVAWLRAYFDREFSLVGWQVSWIQVAFEITHIFTAYLMWVSFFVCLYKAFIHCRYWITAGLMLPGFLAIYNLSIASFEADKRLPYDNDLAGKSMSIVTLFAN